MKIQVSSKDIIWSYVGTIMSMGANLFMLPFLMIYLDEDYLGLWYVFASIGAVAILFDFGFSVTFARNITYCWSGAKRLKKENVEFVENSEPDFFLMKKVLITCKYIYGLISILAFLLLITIGTWYVIHISKSIDQSTVLVAWFVYAFATLLNLYYGYYASFLRGVGAIDQANKNTVFARGIQIIVTVCMLMSGCGIIGAAVAYLSYGTVFRLLGKYYFYRYEGIGDSLNTVKTRISGAQIKELFVVVWHNAWRDGAISICNYLSIQASTIICSLYLSLEETGYYSIGVQIASAIAQISATLYTAYQPALQAAYISSDKKKLKNTMSMIVFSFSVFFLVGTGVVILLGLPLLRVIKPTFTISVSALLGLCIYQFVLKFRDCYTSYFSCTNRISYMYSFIVSSIICVVLSLVLTGYYNWGINGLIISQIVSQLIYNFWRWPILANRELELNMLEIAKIGYKEFKDFINNTMKKSRI